MPLAHVVHDPVGDAADQVPADAHAVELVQVRLDLPRRYAPAVEREDLLVKAREAPLALSHELGFKAPIPIPRGADLDRPMLGLKRLRRRPVARVPGSTRRFPVRLMPK
jgi:hypothetical protein